jgi:hypothetical protein
MSAFLWQLACHVVGDHLLQTEWMARNKTRHWYPALVHSVVYCLPFLFLNPSWQAIAVIGGTHFLIDHTGRKFHYDWWVKHWSPMHFYGNPPPEEEKPLVEKPGQEVIWLTVFIDEVAHVAINYFALSWL